MAQRTVRIPPQVQARLGGLLRVIIAAIGLFGDAMLLDLVPVALAVSDRVRHVVTLVLLEGADQLTAFAPDQLQALVYLSLGCMDKASASAAYLSAVCSLVSNT